MTNNQLITNHPSLITNFFVTFSKPLSSKSSNNEILKIYNYEKVKINYSACRFIIGFHNDIL